MLSVGQANWLKPSLYLIGTFSSEVQSPNIFLKYVDTPNELNTSRIFITMSDGSNVLPVLKYGRFILQKE